MFGAKISMIPMPKNVQRAANKGAYKTLRHAAFSIGKSARGSMIEEEGPSPPGTPPHVHTGRLRRSIRVADVTAGDNMEVVVGPSYSRVKVGGRPPWLAQMLEFGGTFKRRSRWQGKRKRGRPKKGEQEPLWHMATYPARPFMQPALQRNLARFHHDWKGAIS